jgi:hypothetical protein
LVPVVVVTVVLGLASLALAAFPGANGLLAVQPQAGGGIVLVGANGRGARRICVAKARCGTPVWPRWSPDGRALVFAGPGIRIVYPDGSCLNCRFGAAPNPAFEPGGTVISFIQNGQVTLDGIDGIRQPLINAWPATEATWSADGRLAVIRQGTIWAGRPGRLAKIGIGTEPSWSPSGTEIAAVERGWVVVMRVRDHRVRRLVRGTAPAFSPDGRLIAYVAPGHRLMIVGTVNQHPAPRRVGGIQAESVDWQPKPYGPNRGCAAPRGSTILASSRDAVITGDGLPLPSLDFSNARPIAYMSCLRADGRERLLERFSANNVDTAYSIGSTVVDAPYAALVLDWKDEHYGGTSSTVQVFDLRAGLLQTRLGGESTNCPDYSGGCPFPALDQLVLGSDGVSGAHFRAPVSNGNPCAGTTPCSVEQIQASDHTGVRTVDSITFAGSGPFLTALRLNGDVLSWSHAGTPRSINLIH